MAFLAVVIALLLCIAGYQLETRVTALETNDAALASAVKKIDGRVTNGVAVQNDILLKKWQDIKANESESELGQKTEDEIKKLLTNGVWDIEAQIAKQWDEMMTSSVGDVSSLADAANQKAEAAEEAATKAQTTADYASKAANVGIKAIEIIAKPTKPLHHAVANNDKANLRDLIAEWRKENPSK